MKRTIVVHAIQNLNYGGMERLLADIVRCIDPTRFESHVLCLEYIGQFGEGLEKHATLHLAPPLPRYSMLWPGPLVRLLNRIRPDVLHTHSGVWYKMSLAARLAGVPRVVHTDHGRRRPDPWKARFVDGLAARRTDLVVAVSERLARQLDATVVRGRAPIVVIPNAVDTEAHRPQPDDGRLRTRLGISAEAPVLGSVGRLQPIKGYDVVIEAFARLVKSWTKNAPPPHLVVGGDGSERARLKALIERHGLQGRAHLLGWWNDVAMLHVSFDLFTMGSRSEGTSVSLLEAMSAGLCPVVTDVGGNRAVLGEALAHRLVPAEDPEALAEAWRTALDDGIARETDAAAARRRVEVHFGLSRMVGAYEAAYLNRESGESLPGR